MRGSPAVGYLATRSGELSGGVSETHRHEVQMVVGGTEERLGEVAVSYTHLTLPTTPYV